MFFRSNLCTCIFRFSFSFLSFELYDFILIQTVIHSHKAENAKWYPMPHALLQCYDYDYDDNNDDDDVNKKNRCEPPHDFTTS